MMMKMRLQKYLAEKGIDSRRKCDELIVQGRVKVNHCFVTNPGTRIDPNKDLVELDDQTVNREIKKQYVLLNKPRGYLCTYCDPFGRPTVYDLLVDIKTKINYAGRLDYHSEGLVLLTNDGDLIYQLTHPKKGIKKVYIVKIKGIPDSRDLEKLQQGIPLSPTFTTSTCQVKILRKSKNTSTLEVTIQEGKKRQIRRMFLYLKFPVLRLKRIKIGVLSLGNIKSGHYRYLNNQEVNNLKNDVL